MPRPNNGKGQMTQKQFIFAKHYFLTGNGYESAIKAGYSKRSALCTASRLSNYANIKQYVMEMRRKVNLDAVMSQEELLQRLTMIGRGNMSKLAKWDSGGVYPIDSDQVEETAKYAVSELSESKSELGTSLRIKLHDKVKALALLQKHYELINAAKQLNDDPDATKNLSEKVCETISELDDAE